MNSLLLMNIFLWASAFVGIRIGLTAYSPGALALFRFLIASVCMLFLYYQQPSKRKMTWADRLLLMMLGMLGIGVYNICLNIGEQVVTAGIACFIIGLMPVFTLLLSVLFLKERPVFSIYVGIMISLLGLLIMTFQEKAEPEMMLGMLNILASALSGAIFVLLTRRFLQRYHPLAVTSWTIWGGTGMLMMFAPSLWHEVWVAPSSATWSAVYLGVFPAAIAYSVWNYVLNSVPASKATLYLYASPIMATFLGFVLLHETPSMTALLGGLIALGGGIFSAYYRMRVPGLVTE